MFIVYSNCVLESHIDVLRRELLCVNPQLYTRTRTKSRVMGFGWQWAWAKAQHIGRGHWMSSHSMLSRVRASNHLHPVRWVHPSVYLLLVLLLLLLFECVPELPRILDLFFDTFLCFCFSHPTLNPILPRGFQNSRKLLASHSKLESNFSDAGNTLTKKSSRLKPTIVNDHLFVWSNQNLA